MNVGNARMTYIVKRRKYLVMPGLKFAVTRTICLVYEIARSVSLGRTTVIPFISPIRVG